jgi:hypothetical protein
LTRRDSVEAILRRLLTADETIAALEKAKGTGYKPPA